MGSGGRIVDVVCGQQKPQSGSTCKQLIVFVFVRQVENYSKLLPSFTSDTLVKLLFFFTTLDLSFDSNVPTFLNHSTGWAEIEGMCVWCFSF